MGKHEKIAARMAGHPGDGPWHPCYLEYFRLFNEGAYYEAHDVLEHIWLGSAGDIHTFYKALIQFAGGFVHLQHHHREPDHRVHGRRLQPAARLFRRSVQLLEVFPERHEGIDIAVLRATALEFATKLEAGAFATNPLSPMDPPRLAPPSMDG